MSNRILNTRVAGVPYEERQNLIGLLKGDEPCRLIPEPTNPYDKNAIAVHVAYGATVWHIGYIPKEIAAEIAEHLEGENLDCKIAEITGGFELSNGEGFAALGVRLRIELPDYGEVQS